MKPLDNKTLLLALCVIGLTGVVYDLKTEFIAHYFHFVFYNTAPYPEKNFIYILLIAHSIAAAIPLFGLRHETPRFNRIWVLIWIPCILYSCCNFVRVFAFDDLHAYGHILESGGTALGFFVAWMGFNVVFDFGLWIAIGWLYWKIIAHKKIAMPT